MGKVLEDVAVGEEVSRLVVSVGERSASQSRFPSLGNLEPRGSAAGMFMLEIYFEGIKGYVGRMFIEFDCLVVLQQAYLLVTLAALKVHAIISPPRLHRHRHASRR